MHIYTVVPGAVREGGGIHKEPMGLGPSRSLVMVVPGGGVELLHGSVSPGHWVQRPGSGQPCLDLLPGRCRLTLHRARQGCVTGVATRTPGFRVRSPGCVTAEGTRPLRELPGTAGVTEVKAKDWRLVCGGSPAEGQWRWRGSHRRGVGSLGATWGGPWGQESVALR